MLSYIWLFCTYEISLQPQKSRIENKLALSADKEEILLKEDKEGNHSSKTAITIKNM